MTPVAHRLALVLLVVLVAACNAPHSEANKPALSAVPTNYRNDIATAMADIMAERGVTHVRGAEVSEPVMMRIGDAQAFASCVRYSPQIAGAPKGPAANEERLAMFHHGQLTQFPLATPGQCRGAAYQPFPELDRLCFRKKC